MRQKTDSERLSPEVTLIAGAGYTSRSLQRILHEQGRSALTLARRPGADFRVDLDNCPVHLRLPAFEQILYLVPPNEGMPEPRFKAFFDALSASPRRLVLASTSGVYGDCQGRLIDETEALKPGSERAKRRVQLEQTVTDLTGVADTECVILRISGIYGPGRLPLKALREGASVITPDEANPGNRIHVDDLARVCEAALYRTEANGIYNVADGDHRTTSEFYSAVAKASDLPAPSAISRAAAKASFSAQRYSFMAESRRLNISRLTQQLGVDLHYPNMEAGIQASLLASDQG